MCENDLIDDKSDFIEPFQCPPSARPETVIMPDVTASIPLKNPRTMYRIDIFRRVWTFDSEGSAN